MIVLDWNNIWESTISGIFVVMFGGISAWLAYTLGIRGKERSQIASRRKQEIYIPLKYEMKSITDMERNIWKEINTPETKKVLSKNDEFVISEEIYNKCQELNNLIAQYKEINMYSVVADILFDRFKEKYAQLYGSATHIEHVCQPDFEGDFEVNDPEIIAFYETVRDKSNIDNLMENDIYYEEYCRQENYVSPLEEYFSRICASVLPHGEKTYQGIKLIDESLKQKKKTPAEYIAYGFDFFAIYNENTKVKEKEVLLDQIKALALDLYEDLLIKIRSIGNKYEKE
jgi:hypothetical protein